MNYDNVGRFNFSLTRRLSPAWLETIIIRFATAPRWYLMIIPFIALALMLAFIPLGMRDSIWTVGAASGLLAGALMMIAIALPVSSLARLARLLSPALLVVLAAPALWMLLQVAPMPVRALA